MKRIRGGVLATVATLVLTAGAIPAYAQADAGTPDEVAALIADVAPTQVNLAERSAPAGTVLGGFVQADRFAASTGDTSVSISLAEPTVVHVSTQVKGSEGFQALDTAIGLPEGFVSAEGAVAGDGTVVFADSTVDSAQRDAVAIQTLADGSTRVQTVLASPSSVHEFGYRLAGFSPVRDGEGNFGFLREDGLLVPVASPWARDANGNDVATHYEVRGDQIVQVVEPSPATVYPVVADPTWAWWNAAWTLKMNRAETRDIANSSGNAALCGIGLLAGAVPAGVCAALAGYLIGQAGVANGAGECVLIVVAPAPSVWRYKDGDCY